MARQTSKIIIFSLLVSLGWIEQTNALNIQDIAPSFNVPNPAALSAKSVAVINQVSGQLLYEEGGHAKRIPASLTKLVTALVALDRVADWNAKCTLNELDLVGGVQLRYGKNYTYKMSELLNAALIPSSNDAAGAVARCSGLPIDGFVLRMNEKAKQFGAWDTNFVEPTGIDAGNTTTAIDFAKIANGALSTEKLRNILSKQSAKVCSTSPKVLCQTLHNTNQLLGDSELMMVAGKTGYLDESGYNFASSVRDTQGRYYIVVVLGSSSKEARFFESKQLWKFAVQKQTWLDGLAGNFLPGMVAGASSLQVK